MNNRWIPQYFGKVLLEVLIHRNTTQPPMDVEPLWILGRDNVYFIFFILVTQFQILISDCKLHSARLVERNINLSPSWGFPISPQDCVTLLDHIMLRYWGKLSSGLPTPVQFHCFCLLHPLGIVVLSYPHAQLGRCIFGKAVSCPFGLCAPYSHSLPSLRPCCFLGDGTRERSIGTLCPMTSSFSLWPLEESL